MEQFREIKREKERREGEGGRGGGYSVLFERKDVSVEGFGEVQKQLRQRSAYHENYAGYDS